MPRPHIHVKPSRKSHARMEREAVACLDRGSYGAYVTITESIRDSYGFYTWRLLKVCHVHPVTATYIP